MIVYIMSRSTLLKFRYKQNRLARSYWLSMKATKGKKLAVISFRPRHLIKKPNSCAFTLKMHGTLKGGAFFLPCVIVANLHKKTSTETSDTYLRCAENYKACGWWFVAFTSLWVYLTHKQKLHNDSNVCAFVYRIA